MDRLMSPGGNVVSPPRGDRADLQFYGRSNMVPYVFSGSSTGSDKFGVLLVSYS